MHFDVITIFPEMFNALNFGIIGRAQKQGLLQIKYWNPRDYSKNKHHNVDDKPYGGGPGMVMLAEPLHNTIAAIKKTRKAKTRVIHLTPQGKKLEQANIKSFSHQQNIILLASRYEGIDERITKLDIDEEWSIGDYVLSGGELAAMVLMDAVTRMLPGALGDKESAAQDSFMEGLLDYPHYTRPELFNGQNVPKMLLSGNHKQIAEWRLKQSLGRTFLRRPDLLKKYRLNSKEQELLTAFLNEQKLEVNYEQHN